METVRHLGQIIQWSEGYAMSLGTSDPAGWVVRCCEGHPTPTEAKHHGLVRLIELAGRVADDDIKVWAAREDVA